MTPTTQPKPAPTAHTRIKPISFKVTPEQSELVHQIVSRAINMAEFDVDRLSLNMDLRATHANGTPMDFVKLLKAPDFDFAHDVFGIMRHINRDTGKLEDFFLPRCAKHK